MAQESRENLRLDQVAKLREQTENVSQFLSARLKGHLETLRPLLAPARVFGKHVRAPAREDVPGSEIALQKLCEQYNAICARPFSLPSNLADNAVADLDGRIELYAWEYSHETRDANNEVKTITISSPVKSVLTYRSAYTLSQIRSALTGKGDRQQQTEIAQPRKRHIPAVGHPAKIETQDLRGTFYFRSDFSGPTGRVPGLRRTSRAAGQARWRWFVNTGFECSLCGNRE